MSRNWKEFVIRLLAAILGATVVGVGIWALIGGLIAYINYVFKY